MLKGNQQDAQEMDFKNLLLKTGLFEKFKPEELDELLSLVQEISLPENQIFIKKGDPADALYVIKEGVCQVFLETERNHEIILARLEQGTYFGEQALLTETPGRRTANVRTLSPCQLLKVPHLSFQKALSYDETLKKNLQRIGRQQMKAAMQIENLHKIYISRKRGEIRQYHGQFLNKPAVISNFFLGNGREVFAARVIDENIQTVQDTKIKPDQEIPFESENIYRKLLIENNILAGVISIGEWENLPQIINMIFNQTPLDKDQLNYFKTSGELSLIIPQISPAALDDEEIICNCMSISLAQIKGQINSGATTLNEISDALGAGTVCGTCQWQIQNILGHGSWQAVRIKKILPLNSYIRAYQLTSALGEPLPSYKPGQNIVLQCLIDNNWVSRTYTLTSHPSYSEYYEIAIQREEGGSFSNWIFEHENQVPLLRVSVPDGKFTPNLGESVPLICLMAGIGITPAVAFARGALEIKSQRPISIYFSAHTESDFAYLSELKKLSELLPSITLTTRITQTEGRLEQNDLAQIHQKFPNAEYFICGPGGFGDNMRSYLKNLGIAENRIFTEEFTHSYDPA